MCVLVWSSTSIEGCNRTSGSPCFLRHRCCTYDCFRPHILSTVHRSTSFFPDFPHHCLPCYATRISLFPSCYSHVMHAFQPYFLVYLFMHAPSQPYTPEPHDLYPSATQQRMAKHFYPLVCLSFGWSCTSSLFVLLSRDSSRSRR